MLTVLSPSHSNGRYWFWNVKCDCGNIVQMPCSEITKGAIKSCGCARKTLIGNATRKHGMVKHPAYWVWRSMRDRCRLPTHQAYKNYGGRGIAVCERWDTSFSAFWEDMSSTYQPGLVIDRIDNNGNYSPENCRWTTHQENNRNKRGNRMIDTPKGLMLLSEASEISGIGKTTLCYRLGANWPTEKLFEKP